MTNAMDGVCIGSYDFKLVTLLSTILSQDTLH